mmetsp:Transcript_859/g.2287  ORF Transcript_859/g.2287 Transcript_859/m.2287 type:complete len:273 (-) Transcript_859:112-930(-)
MDALDQPRKTRPRDKFKMKRTVIDSYNSTRRSAPQIGFGTSTRPPLNDAGSDAPGPGAYRIKSTLLGNTPDSRIKSTPQFSLRGREKFGSPDGKAIDPTTVLEPGPGHYKTRMLNDRERKAPAYSFPKGSHPKMKSKFGPAPGSYNIVGAMGPQPLSTRTSKPAASFGKGSRPELLQQSTADVGPGEYGTGISACFKQVDSRKRTCSSLKFGTGTRVPKASSKERRAIDRQPGPGQYKLPSGLCGGGSAYPYRSSPKASMSGRENFMSPFSY